VSPAPAQIEREDVLDAFAVESDTSPETLARYLRDFPQFARELIDLGRELGRDICEDDAPLRERESVMIDEAWRRHAAAAPRAVALDPFAALSAADMREVARRLDVPRQVVTAFRERRVVVETVPRPFLSSLAEALHGTVDHLVVSLSTPTSLALARSYKADGKPTTPTAVSFEQILVEAGVPSDRRVTLLADAD
jgi:hypothetical protein